ncbi:hypothetical protein [Listeria grandensis]|uniref:hypothetical protein n=1 Tax=Listeria grandensis TaxID=1494963 RepID=UPI00164DEAD1|nr:hypothetical protein [Listeria grandensis]MBC6315766.1 hypothetical protein [Listeria grandensis]
MGNVAIPNIIPLVVKTPDSYILDPTPIDFTVTLGQATTVNLTAINQLKGIRSVEHRVSKKVLAGAEFELQDVNSIVIQIDLVTKAPSGY